MNIVIDLSLLLILVFLYPYQIIRLVVYPKRIFDRIRKKTLGELDHISPEEWEMYDPLDEYWSLLKERSLKVLAEKKKRVALMVFVHSGLIFIGWAVITFCFLTGARIGLDIPTRTLVIFLCAHIPMFGFFYWWHVKHFESYMQLGDRDAFAKELSEHLEKISRKTTSQAHM